MWVVLAIQIRKIRVGWSLGGVPVSLLKDCFAIFSKRKHHFLHFFSPLRKLFAGSHTVKLNREHYMFTYKIHILKCANYANNSLGQNSAHTEHFHEKDVLIKTVYFSRKMVFEWAEKSCTLEGWCKESRLSNI